MEPVIFLRSQSYFYGASHISTEPVIFLRSQSYFYGASHISTEPVIFLRSHKYFYGATQISTESVIFLRSQLYFHGARVFPWSIHISMKQPNFYKKCAYVLLCEAVSLVGQRNHLCLKWGHPTWRPSLAVTSLQASLWTPDALSSLSAYQWYCRCKHRYSS
jgi:hypothetical protein